MKRGEIILAFFMLVAVAAIFFYKTVFHGAVPFPGDLLIAEYNPWKSYSYLGYNPGSFPNKAQYFDIIRQIYPWKTFSVSLIKNAVMPLWNPYNFSGAPLLANFQSAVFYPFSLFYLVLKEGTAWTLLIILQPILAGFFTYLYARKIKIEKLGAFFASVAFSYSLFMSVFLEYNTVGHTIAYLPLALFLIERFIEKRNFWNIIFLSGSIILSSLSGHIQIFGFVLGFVLLYGFLRIVLAAGVLSQRIRSLGIFLFIILLSLGVCAIQLFSTIELINASARVSQSYKFLVEKLLIQPYQLILFLSPDIFGNPATRNYLIPDTYPGNALYIGLIPFIFALISLVKSKRNYFVSFFGVTSIILLLFFTRSPFTEIFYKFNIPFVSTGSPTNAIFLLSFSLSILAGFGIEKWSGVKNKKELIVVLSLSILFFLLWFLKVGLHPAIFSNKNLLYSTILFSLFIFTFFVKIFFVKNKNIVVVFFIILTVFDLFYFFQKFNPFVSSKLVFPDTKVFSYLGQNSGINRFWGYGSAAVEANFATEYSLFSPDGYDPLYPKRYGEFIQTSRDGKIVSEFSNSSRSDAIVAPGYGENDLMQNKYRLKVLDTLGVKYILDRVENGSTEKTFPSERFKLVYEDSGWKVFENKKASPRAFFAESYQVFKEKSDFGNMFFTDSLDSSKTVILEENLGKTYNPAEKDKLDTILYSPNKVIFATSTSSPRILFLSDTYYPGWKAFIDGRETKIYRADYAFRAILVPSGIHKAEFAYSPESFSVGLKTTIISLIVLFAFSLGINYRKRKS